MGSRGVSSDSSSRARASLHANTASYSASLLRLSDRCRGMWVPISSLDSSMSPLAHQAPVRDDSMSVATASELRLALGVVNTRCTCRDVSGSTEVQWHSSVEPMLEDTLTTQRLSDVEPGGNAWKGSCLRDQEILFTASSTPEQYPATCALLDVKLASSPRLA